MATWFPITGTVIQRIKSDGKPASGYVLKLYVPGTTTNIPIATDSTGATTATVATANSAGDWTVSGNAIIPHINQDYKLAIYPTQAAADSDTGATLTIDNLSLAALANVQWVKGDDLASAAALPVISGGTYFDVTGTTTITSINSIGVGRVIKLHFDDVLTLTHNATTLVLPSAANITTAAGDEAEFVEYSAGAWRCTNYSRADGNPVAVSVVEDSSPQLGGNLSANGKQIQWSKGADVASAAELPVLTDGNYFDVTGTTTVTSIATTAVGNLIKLHFDDALTLTHHATDLILPGGANITTAAGDEAEFIEYAAGDYRCTSYQKADGTPVTVGSSPYVYISTVTATTATTADIEGLDSTYSAYQIRTDITAMSGGARFYIQVKIGGSWITTSTYDGFAVAGLSNSSTVTGRNGANAAQLDLTGAVSMNGQGSFVTEIENPSNATKRKTIYSRGGGVDASGNQITFSGSGSNQGTGAVTGIRFLLSNASTFTGTFDVYGIKNS